MLTLKIMLKVNFARTFFINFYQSKGVKLRYDGFYISFLQNLYKNQLLSFELRVWY